MAMIVIGSQTMCCMDCGGFHFLAQDGIVFHPVDPRYTKFVGRVGEPCPNSGKRFSFPSTPPTEAIEVKEPRYDNFFVNRPLEEKE